MSGQPGQDAKFFQRGKIEVGAVDFHLYSVTNLSLSQEFRAELQAAEAKDKKFQKRKIVLKKIVANITMGNDSEHHHIVLSKFIDRAATT